MFSTEFYKVFDRSAKRLNVELESVDPTNLILKYDDKLKITLLGGEDFLSFDAYIFPPQVVDGKSVKIDSKRLLQVLIAKYLRDNNKVMMDFGSSLLKLRRDKMFDFYKLSKCNIPLIPTIYIENNLIGFDNFKELVSGFNPPFILKPINGMKGRDIHKMDTIEQVYKVISENPDIHFMLQKFIKIDHDLRIIVLGDKVLGAMDKIPMEGDFRGNISAGARGETFALTPKISNLAIEVAKSEGCELSGIDIAVSGNDLYVLEINKSLGFSGFMKYTGIDVAEEIIKYIISKQELN